MNHIDEFRVALAYQAAHGFPAMPDHGSRGPSTSGVNWRLALTPRDGQSLDAAIETAARWGVATAPCTARVGGGSSGDVMTRIPVTEDVAQLMRDMLDARVAEAERRIAESDPGNRDVKWHRESVRRDAENRLHLLPPVAQAAAQAEADAKAFDARVQAEAARRIATMQADS